MTSDTDRHEDPEDKRQDEKEHDDESSSDEDQEHSVNKTDKERGEERGRAGHEEVGDDAVLAREIIPRGVTHLVVEDQSCEVETTTIVCHKIARRHSPKTTVIRKRSKTAVSSSKHYALNKDKINKKRREASLKARQNETAEQKEERIMARRKRDQARIEKMLESTSVATMEKGSMLKCGERKADTFEKKNAEGKYTRRKREKVVRYVTIEHDFEEGIADSTNESEIKLAVISGRRETGADVTGEFAFCQSEPAQNEEEDSQDKECDGADPNEEEGPTTKP